jgi:hypothetical protein
MIEKQSVVEEDVGGQCHLIRQVRVGNLGYGTFVPPFADRRMQRSFCCLYSTGNEQQRAFKIYNANFTPVLKTPTPPRRCWQAHLTSARHLRVRK